MQENVDFMQELSKMLLEWIRKQGATVVLLCAGIYFMHTEAQAQVAKLEAKISAQEQKIETQGDEISKCNSERSSLQSEVSFLKMQLEIAFPRLRLSKK